MVDGGAKFETASPASASDGSNAFRAFEHRCGEHITPRRAAVYVASIPVPVNDFPGVTQVVYDSEARNKREGFRPGEICLSAVYCRGIYTYRRVTVCTGMRSNSRAYRLSHAAGNT